MLRGGLPCRVKVMDCSNFSSSSVSVRFRCAGPDMVVINEKIQIVDRVEESEG
jgi:hypothetical protein